MSKINVTVADGSVQTFTLADSQLVTSATVNNDDGSTTNLSVGSSPSTDPVSKVTLTTVSGIVTEFAGNSVAGVPTEAQVQAAVDAGVIAAFTPKS